MPCRHSGPAAIQAQIYVGVGQGSAPFVSTYNLAGQATGSFLAYDSGFQGGVRVAAGSDGDIITAAGPGAEPLVNVFSGPNHTLSATFSAYAQLFTGGVNVATGINGDIITGAGAGGAPQVPLTLPDQGTYNWRPASLLTNSYTGTGQPHPGTFSGILPNVTYRPAPRSYAPDSFTYLFPTGFGNVISFCLVSAGITVLPAPERSGPAMVSEVSGGKVVPKLRGLNGHRYRVERSADLTAWGLAGEVTGNFTEVDLSPFLTLGAQAQYLRTTDLTPQ